MTADQPDNFGVVVIGRNEGERLKKCLKSALKAATTVYVDSGSSDGSLELARTMGADVVELDRMSPFTAARARNIGYKRLRDFVPALKYVQFMDGDCELNDTWPSIAITYLDSHRSVSAVLGRRRERYPDRSIYNRMCDNEWNTPLGEVLACGGDVMMRASAFEAVGGYRRELIAGEEPELCVRLRAAGGKVWRLDHEMTLHDAAMLHFGQWWRRQTRSGYAFALGAYLHGDRPERHWVWESRRAMLWGVLFPFSVIISLLHFGSIAAVMLLIYPLQMMRRMTHRSGSWRSRAQFAFFEQLSRFPEAIGQSRFALDRLFRRRSRLIEYK
jgi:glycosyltransferase involved in cell wall biosynthesis